MTNALAVVLGLALSSGVVYAQAAPATPPPGGAVPSKRAPRPKRPPAKKPADPVPAATPAATLPAPAPDPGKPRDKPGTDEKAGVNESLQGDATEKWKEGVSRTEQEAALVLFREGNVALNDGLFVPSVTKYREALKHWNHPAIHYNLALALLNLDQPIEVYEQLNQAIIYGAAPLATDKYEHAKEYLLLVEKQLADIEVSCDKIGAKVSVDGKEAFIAPGKFTQKVRVGKHTFYADKQGYNARITAPYIGPGEKFRIELKLYTAEELTRYRRKWDRTWVPYAVMGVGVVAGIVGGALELSANTSFKDFDAKVATCNANNPTANGGCSATEPGLKSLRDSGNTKRTAGFVMYGVAGGAIVTGAVLAWLNRRESYQIQAEQLSEEHIAVVPVVAPGLAGAMVQGRF
ncbi:MAG: hypothetical protein ABIY55_02840 [Kofleriaceae bacterium]